MYLVVVGITVLGCARKPKVPVAGDSPENQATLHKLQGFIRCFDPAPRMFELEDTYLARFGSAAPTLESDTPIQPSPDPAECITELMPALALEPHLADLEREGIAYANTLVKLRALTKTEYDAFDRLGKHYQPAVGVALHPAVVAAFHELDTTEAALFDHVYALNHKVHEDQLERRVKFDGRTFTLLNEDIVLRAEDLVHAAAVPVDCLDALALDDVAARVSVLEGKVDEMSAYADEHPKEASELIKPFWPMQEAAKKVVIAGKQLVSRARQHLAFTDAEKIMLAAGNEASVIGTPAALVEAYNAMLVTYRPTTVWPR